MAFLFEIGNYRLDFIGKKGERKTNLDNFVQCTVPNSSAYSAVHVLLSQFHTYFIQIRLDFFWIFTTFIQMLSYFILVFSKRFRK